MYKIFLSIVAAAMILGCQSSTKSSSEVPTTDPAEKPADLTNTDDLEMDRLMLPDGFEIDVYGRVKNARSLAIGDDGTIYVSNRNGGSVYAVRDTDGDFKIDERYEIASGLNMPNGVAYKDGSLYVAEVDKLWRYDNIADNLTNPIKSTISGKFVL